MTILDQNYVKRMRKWIESPNRNAEAIKRMRAEFKNVETNLFPDLEVLPSVRIEKELNELRDVASRLFDLKTDVEIIIDELLKV